MRKSLFSTFFISFLLSNVSIAKDTTEAGWDTVSSNLMMPYGILVKSQKVLVSTIPTIGSIDEETGAFYEKTALANGSPAGFIKAENGYVVVENGTGRLLAFDKNFSDSQVIAEGLGDPITVKETKDAYLVVDYNFGLPNGRLMSISKKSKWPVSPKILLTLDGPGSFYVDKNDLVYISKFDSGDLIEFNLKTKSQRIVATGLGRPLDVVRVNKEGFLVSDFGGFDTTGRLLFVSNEGAVVTLNSDSIANPTGLFLTEKFVYTTDMTGGKLLKARTFNLLCSSKQANDLNKKFCKK